MYKVYFLSEIAVFLMNDSIIFYTEKSLFWKIF